MRKKLTAWVGVLLLATLAWAGDPWKDKSYKEWNDKEVRKIMNDSPWARRVDVEASWAGGGSAPASGAKDDNLPSGAPKPGQVGAERGEGGGGAEMPSGGAEGPQIPRATFIILWASARVPRQAWARSNILRGAVLESEAEKFVAQQPTEYQIVVQGPDMTPFAKVDEKALKEKTYLLGKKSKQKLLPSRVDFQRGRDGKRVTAVAFYFAKKTESGEAAFAPDEKGIEFVCQAGSTALKTNFEPQKMADKQGTDL